ncbi:MAG TPA: alginate lyase family protein [Bryocella sp.]|nr:alginate lyase family protein [Bryocella sp.]
MTTKILALSALILAVPLLSFHALAQKISNPAASVLDVQARQAFLKSTDNSLIRAAIAHLGSCTSTALVPAPIGPMQIPHHYMHGSNGPINPAEGEATRTYAAFEHRITSGMNRWVATGNQAEAQCALSQLDAWAQAGALTNYDTKAYSQSWYQAEWTLCSAGVTASVLQQDPLLDGAQQERVAHWLNRAAHQLISYEKPDQFGNNHHYWRALASTSIGVLSNDNDLFRFGVNVFKQAVSQEDENGAFPLEMARHENAIHYQSFALQPLIMIAEFAERQQVDLYAVTDHGRTIRNAVVFLGQAIADPATVKQYTSDEQKTNFSAGDIAELDFYLARFGPAGLSPSLTNLLSHPAAATRIGGSATVLAAK